MPNYYGIGHSSLDNYIAMIGGQPPNPTTQADCPTFQNMSTDTTDSFGAVDGSGAEIINHSCAPNLYACIMKGHILYMSKRAIRAGKELTVDYRFSDDVHRVRCRCGAVALKIASAMWWLLPP